MSARRVELAAWAVAVLVLVLAIAADPNGVCC